MRTYIRKILFELKCDVANDTKEDELGIESVRTIVILVLRGPVEPI